MLERQRLSNCVQLTWLAVAACVLIELGGGSPLHAGEDAADPTALVAEGPVGDAYRRLVEERRSQDPASLQELSRAVLEHAIRSDDAFERWAGLRASRLVADPALAAAARDQLHSGSRYEEALALEILAKADPVGSRDDFVTALDSPYRTVRLRALRALQPRPDETLVVRLAILATNDDDPDIRVLAIRSLQRWAMPDAVPPLRRGLNDPVPAVQQETVKALAALGDPELPAAVRQRIVEASPETRIAALRLAALVPQPEMLDTVGPFLADANPEVRVAAAAAVLAIVQKAEPAR